MQSFRKYINEQVLPSVQVADGGLDIEKPAVRAAINAAIAGVTSQPAVTPYVVYNRLSKLLAQYHIVLPRKFLEGDKGVEVFEIRQFGHKMGMTDGGEFVNEVPSTHYLFLQYGIITPFGITYAKPVVGGMFRVMARIVDKAELDNLLDMAEITMKEEAECRQNAAKAMAPKEEMHDITSDEKKKGNKEAVKDSEKGLDEASVEKLIRYRNKAEKESMRNAAVATMRQPGLTLADKKLKGKAKVNATAPKHPYMEETLEETHADNIRRKYRQKEDDNDHTGNVHLLTRVFGSKKERETSKGLLQKRNKQGYVTGSDSQKGYNMTKDYARRMEKLKEEEQIDEVSKGAAISAYRGKEAEDRSTTKLRGLIRRKWGEKTVKHAERAGAADTGNLVRRGESHGTDRLASAKPSSEMRKSKKGKIHKQDVASKKFELKHRHAMSKFDSPRGHLPEDYSFSESADDNRIDEAIDRSTSHKVVHRDSKKIIAQGSKKQMMKQVKALNVKNPGSHFLGNSPSKKVGDTFSEGRMPASVIRHKQKLANMTPEEKAKKFAGKSEEQLKSMARRHGYGKDSTEYSKHLTKEDKDPCWKGYEMIGMKKKGARKVPNCVPVNEKLTKSMSAGDVISDFVHSDDPKFKGKSKKERQRMALGAYYGMHPEKSKK